MKAANDDQAFQHEDASEDPMAENLVENLLRFAGPRVKIAADARARLDQVASLAWQEKVQVLAARRRQRMWRGLAAAAVVLASVGLAVLLQWTPTPQTPDIPASAVKIASVETLSHKLNVLAHGATGSMALVTPGADLEAGSEIFTEAAGRAALRMAGGFSVRLDVETRLRLLSAHRIELLRGAVYLDSGSSAGADALSDGPTMAVITPWGVARDIGTQFEVRLLEDDAQDGVLSGVQVSVREGEVELDAESGPHTAKAGTLLTLRDNGAVQRETIPSYGGDWSWVLETSPPFELEGGDIQDFLDWVVRETGWRLRFEDAELERQVTIIETHGSIQGLTLEEAVRLVLASSKIDYSLRQGTLRIRRAW